MFKAIAKISNINFIKNAVYNLLREMEDIFGNDLVEEL